MLLLFYSLQPDIFLHIYFPKTRGFLDHILLLFQRTCFLYLYLELAPHGVRATCLIPASANTGFTDACGIAAAPQMLGPEDIAETALFIADLPQRAVVEDITVWGIDQIVNPL